MMVGPNNFPTIYRAFTEIQFDNAGGLATEYEVPDSLIRVLPTIERTFAALPLGDLVTLCVGEDTEQQKITARSRDNEFAAELLSEFFSRFHDWS
jgi:hypothetical protein